MLSLSGLIHPVNMPIKILKFCSVITSSSSSISNTTLAKLSMALLTNLIDQPKRTTFSVKSFRRSLFNELSSSFILDVISVVNSRLVFSTRCCGMKWKNRSPFSSFISSIHFSIMESICSFTTVLILLFIILVVPPSQLMLTVTLLSSITDKSVLSIFSVQKIHSADRQNGFFCYVCLDVR